MHSSKYKKYSNEWFLDLYFKYGSVEEALKLANDDLPLSAATFYRMVKNAEIVSSAGRHVSFPEALHFFRLKAMQKGTPIEKMYKKMPHTFKTSLVTLHRIYNAVEKQIVRREATVLLISHPEDKNKIVVGLEVENNLRYNKKSGDISVPTSFSKKGESHKDSILRVLQQEFSTQLAIENSLNDLFKLNNITPFMTLDIIDVRVKVFSLVCPIELLSLKQCSSYKLKDYNFMNVEELIKNKDLRAGGDEILYFYQRYLKGETTQVVTSKINLDLKGMESNLQLA